MYNLDKLYGQMAKIHEDAAPEIRIGQMFENFREYMRNKYGNDLFYLEDEKLLEYFKEYLSTKDFIKKDILL